jgi:hypothetical protein
MAKVFNYTDRIGQDDCFLTEKDLENDAFARYRATPTAPCSAQKCLDFAVSEPQGIPRGGYAFTDVGGHGVDQDSSLRMAPSTQEKQRLTLLQRQFATVPYLGRGHHDAQQETVLRNGILTNTRRLNDSITERTFTGQWQPLVPSVQATITNPANLVEGAADSGWVRGGLPTRQFARTTANIAN